MKHLLLAATTMLTAATPAPDLVAAARAGRLDVATAFTARLVPADGRFAAFKAWVTTPSNTERTRWTTARPCAAIDSRGYAHAVLIVVEGSPNRATADMRWREVDAAYSAGLSTERQNLAIARRAAARRPTAIGRALALRVALDQAWRTAMFEKPHDDVTAEAISYRLGAQLCHVDADNLAWLKAVVTAGRWPIMSRDGDGAAHDAWLLAQHADNDNGFQDRVLTLIESLVRRNEASGKDYALLFDRVAISRKRPQRYATQFDDDIDRKCLSPLPTEDPAGVDARRGAAGLEPLADYARALGDLYKQAICAPLFIAPGVAPVPPLR